MFDFSAGFTAVWDNNYSRPVKNPSARQWPGGHPLYDEVEWLRGYDAGLTACVEYREGKIVGFANGELPKGAPEAWRDGWYSGKKKLLRSKLLPLLKAYGPLKMVVQRTNYGDYDDIEGVEYRGGITYSPLKKSELLSETVGFLMGRHGKNSPIPTTVKELVEIFLAENESEFGRVCILTLREAKKERDEAEYAKMEAAAQHFAASCGHQLGTAKFVRALERAVSGVRHQQKGWNNPEVRAEEWAAHQFAGGGSEGYFDDLNFENGRYDSRLEGLDKVWAYLERKFPLLMMRYKESRLRRQNKT